jgi:hypothetical protein
VGARSRGIPDTFVDELLLVFMFPEYLGSEVDPKHPNQAILIPQDRIPSLWKEYAEAGVVRIQEVKNNKYRLWKPYHFLLKWMKEKSVVFDFQDVHGLSSEITAGISAPDKRKGYCLQRASMILICLLIDSIISCLGTSKSASL